MVKKNLKKIEVWRKKLLEEIQGSRFILPGHFGTIYRKCGKPNCKCVSEEGHQLNRITWIENLKSKSRSIPKEDIGWIKQVTENYRTFKRIKRKIIELNLESKKLVDELEVELINKTRQHKKYLM